MQTLNQKADHDKDTLFVSDELAGRFDETCLTGESAPKLENVSSEDVRVRVPGRDETSFSIIGWDLDSLTLAVPASHLEMFANLDPLTSMQISFFGQTKRGMYTTAEKKDGVWKVTVFWA